ncbi:MAG: L,D-transpeptidase [Armatimonadota bacterium]|nr:L,D-transpeptidase [Armatimonadota bacterium]
MAEMKSYQGLSKGVLLCWMVLMCSIVCTADAVVPEQQCRQDYGATDNEQPVMPPSIRITYPPPFADLSDARQIRITWESTYGDDVQYSIVMSRDGKAFDVEIASKLETTDYVWSPNERPLAAWVKVKVFRKGYQLGEATVPVSFLPAEAIIVSRADQKVYHISSGMLANVFVCSTALPKYDINEGIYRVYLKARKHWSKKWQVWMPFSLFFHEGYAIHATSVIKRLGHPASHGCVRLHPRDAKKLYSQVTVGTPVLMLPTSQRCAALELYFQQSRVFSATTAASSQLPKSK